MHTAWTKWRRDWKLRTIGLPGTDMSLFSTSASMSYDDPVSGKKDVEPPLDKKRWALSGVVLRCKAKEAAEVF